MPCLAYNSPLGPLSIFEEDEHIVALDWGWPPLSEETPLLSSVFHQLEAYFSRQLNAFDVPLAPRGTAFQHRVWNLMQQIPYGQIRTYGDIATELGTSPRAIGGACGRNPIPILIPCHRIIARNGALGGYSGLDGIETKEWLLRLEGALAP